MWNVKKSILSLWKARKERLSEEQKKTPKESEKNLQSTARERKFLSSKPLKETNPEAEIYEAINWIEFQFGKETHTVGEANLLFAYEVGLDLFTVYVIALSEHYGAIVFYLPEDLTREIARHLPPDETFQRYIANLIERQAGLRNINTVLKGFGMGCEAAAEALLELSAAVGKVMDKPIDYREMPNNWLKMHHKPMRRKGKGRKNK